MEQQTRPNGWFERIPRGSLVAGVLALVLFAVAGGWLLRPERHTITLTGLGEPITFVATQQELGAALKAQGITLGEKDRVEPALTTSLKGHKTLTVSLRKAVDFTLNDGGQERQVETSAHSIGEALQEMNITLGEKDELSVPMETEPTAGMQVKLTRRSEQIVTTQEEIPFETVTRDDATLRLGTTQVVQAGETGVNEVQRRVLTENGQEVGSEVVGEQVVKEPVNELVAYGTLGVVSRGGRDYRYTQELDMVSTGYTGGPESNAGGNGYTYTGMKAVRGVVAVDPNVIPLYTRLYIEGYGPAIAGDTGGAIKGNKIDLCFDRLDEALQWGMRPVKVYILGE